MRANLIFAMLLICAAVKSAVIQNAYDTVNDASVDARVRAIAASGTWAITNVVSGNSNAIVTIANQTATITVIGGGSTSSNLDWNHITNAPAFDTLSTSNAALYKAFLDTLYAPINGGASFGPASGVLSTNGGVTQLFSYSPAGHIGGAWVLEQNNNGGANYVNIDFVSFNGSATYQTNTLSVNTQTGSWLFDGGTANLYAHLVGNSDTATSANNVVPDGSGSANVNLGSGTLSGSTVNVGTVRAGLFYGDGGGLTNVAAASGWPTTWTSNSIFSINPSQIYPTITTTVNSNTFTGQLNYGQIDGVPPFLISIPSNYAQTNGGWWDIAGTSRADTNTLMSLLGTAAYTSAGSYDASGLAVSKAHDATNTFAGWLGSAAWTASSAYDAAGAGATAANQSTNTLIGWLGSAAFTASSAYDASGVGATKAQQATNTFASWLGTAAYKAISYFDLAGAGTTAANSVGLAISNGLPPTVLYIGTTNSVNTNVIYTFNATVGAYNGTWIWDSSTLGFTNTQPSTLEIIYYSGQYEICNPSFPASSSVNSATLESTNWSGAQGPIVTLFAGRVQSKNIWPTLGSAAYTASTAYDASGAAVNASNAAMAALVLTNTQIQSQIVVASNAAVQAATNFAANANNLSSGTIATNRIPMLDSNRLLNVNAAQIGGTIPVGNLGNSDTNGTASLLVSNATFYPFIVNNNTNVVVSPTNGNLQSLTSTNNQWITVGTPFTNVAQTFRLDIYDAFSLTLNTNNMLNNFTNVFTLSNGIPCSLLFDHPAQATNYWRVFQLE